MFVEEEGSRFGIACLGSRLATGLMAPDERARAPGRATACSCSTRWRRAGLEPELGRVALLRRRRRCSSSCTSSRVATWSTAASPSAWRRRAGRTARWRFDFTGEPNHAGATAMEDRHDPMLTYAMTALAANKQARLGDAAGDVRPGRRRAQRHQRDPVPRARLGSTPAAPTPSSVERAGGGHRAPGAGARRARRHGGARHRRVRLADRRLRPRRSPCGSLRVLGGVPVIPTGAGHDAGDPPAGRHPVGDGVRPQPDRASRTRPRSSPTPATASPGSTPSTTVLRELAA